jgi:GINS complex subunit 3
MKVCSSKSPKFTPVIILRQQTFRQRLVEVIDQAQHFAALGPAGGGGSTGDSTQSFREGLDGTERECECPVQDLCHSHP